MRCEVQLFSLFSELESSEADKMKNEKTLAFGSLTFLNDNIPIKFHDYDLFFVISVLNSNKNMIGMWAH